MEKQEEYTKLENLGPNHCNETEEDRYSKLGEMEGVQLWCNQSPLWFTRYTRSGFMNEISVNWWKELDIRYSTTWGLYIRSMSKGRDLYMG
jgi:hypothetical protein